MQNLASFPNPFNGIIPAEKEEFVNDLTTLNLGPTHPATHGVFQNILQMDGEKNYFGCFHHWIHPPGV